jgi:hypothetical protein
MRLGALPEYRIAFYAHELVPTAHCLAPILAASSVLDWSPFGRFA